MFPRKYKNLNWPRILYTVFSPILQRRSRRNFPVAFTVLILYLLFFSLFGAIWVWYESKKEQEIRNVHNNIEEVSDNIVTEVVDGDTIKYLESGEEVTVRLIGIDTPELHHPAKPVECFALEAKSYLEKLILGKNIRVSPDPTQDVQDRYGRSLLYIWRDEDDLFINLDLIEKGYAYEYTYDDPYKFQDEFRLAQTNAQNNRVGLWGDKCNGNR